MMSNIRNHYVQYENMQIYFMKTLLFKIIIKKKLAKKKSYLNPSDLCDVIFFPHTF